MKTFEGGRPRGNSQRNSDNNRADYKRSSDDSRRTSGSSRGGFGKSNAGYHKHGDSDELRSEKSYGDNRRTDRRSSERSYNSDRTPREDRKPWERSFNPKRESNSFDERMKTPDNKKFTGKKVDKASKYYDAPDYVKRKDSNRNSENRGFAKPNKFKPRAYEDFDDESIVYGEKFRKSNYLGKSEKAKPISSKKNDNGEMRLNKYIANSGMCSRREADTYIAAGVVTVNGEVVTELGTRVKYGDEVKFGGEKINPEKNVYILLNKPKNCVTTLDDPEERKTVMDIVKDACPERIYPVGRLDRNTTGLLLLTNDGDLTKKLTHPSYEKKKIYQVETDKDVTRADLQKMIDGFDLEDGFISVDNVSYVGDSKNEIGIEIHSGRNRIVRRMLEFLGYQVKKLDRVYFAGLTKLNLPRGKWRFLTEKEVNILKSGMYE